MPNNVNQSHKWSKTDPKFLVWILFLGLTDYQFYDTSAHKEIHFNRLYMIHYFDAVEFEV